MIKACTTKNDYENFIKASKNKPMFLLKHSSSCPISAAALREFELFSGSFTTGECWKVLVREDKALSLAIAEETGIPHQSPQVILFIDEKPAWHSSHRAITAQSLSESLPEH